MLRAKSAHRDEQQEALVRRVREKDEGGQHSAQEAGRPLLASSQPGHAAEAKKDVRDRRPRRVFGERNVKLAAIGS